MFIGLALKRKEERRMRKKNEENGRKRRKEDRRMRKKTGSEERKKKGRGEMKKPHEECVRVSLGTCVAHPTHLRNNVGDAMIGTVTIMPTQIITPSEKVVTFAIKT